MRKLFSKRLSVLAAVWLLTSPVAAQQSKAAEWDGWRFLLGEWIAEEGGGKPGQATKGGLSFNFDLQGKVLIKRSYSEYPASKDRPAFRHEELTTIYREANGAHAISFDSEGHVIRYTVTMSGDNRTLTFLSEAAPASPRFRLIIIRTGEDTMKTEFYIAPPNNPDAFSKYVEGTVRRK